MVLTYGAAKYGAENWRKVQDGRNRYYAAALRHLLAWREGELTDQESGLDHISHAMTNLVFLSELDRASQEGKEPPKQQSCLDVWNVTEKPKILSMEKL
jgi:hypothetical protein